ncbi:MAG: cyclic nucleotide-binding domain-containing protein [Candidatus Omnitrophica bacterium]|nr:cyclic nucleotide-binding domain-containing protein [Candidatus Omnitrophota bacterium]
MVGRVEVYKEAGGKRLVLARLGPGQFFGEMNLVLESTRSASIAALEDCVLRVITQETFNRLLRKDPKSALPLLRVLFERLRIMNLKYLQLLESRSSATSAPAMPGPRIPPLVVTEGEREAALPPGEALVLVGETKVAEQVVGKGGRALCKFPFRMGRKVEGMVDDALSFNDLYLPDAPPYQVSRNHCAIDLTPDGNYLVVQDRGSRLGTLVNEERIGGEAGKLEAVLMGPENHVVLGTSKSPFRFSVVRQRPSR